MSHPSDGHEHQEHDQLPVCRICQCTLASLGRMGLRHEGGSRLLSWLSANLLPEDFPDEESEEIRTMLKLRPF